MDPVKVDWSFTKRFRKYLTDHGEVIARINIGFRKRREGDRTAKLEKLPIRLFLCVRSFKLSLNKRIKAFRRENPNLTAKELVEEVERLKVPIAEELGITQLITLPYNLQFHQLSEETYALLEEQRRGKRIKTTAESDRIYYQLQASYKRDHQERYEKACRDLEAAAGKNDSKRCFEIIKALKSNQAYKREYNGEKAIPNTEETAEKFISFMEELNEVEEDQEESRFQEFFSNPIHAEPNDAPLEEPSYQEVFQT